MSPTFAIAPTDNGWLSYKAPSTQAAAQRVQAIACAIEAQRPLTDSELLFLTRLSAQAYASLPPDYSLRLSYSHEMAEILPHLVRELPLMPASFYRQVFALMQEQELDVPALALREQLYNGLMVRVALAHQAEEALSVADAQQVSRTLVYMAEILLSETLTAAVARKTLSLSQTTLLILAKWALFMEQGLEPVFHPSRQDPLSSDQDKGVFAPFTFNEETMSCEVRYTRRACLWANLTLASAVPYRAITLQLDFAQLRDLRQVLSCSTCADESTTVLPSGFYFRPIPKRPDEVTVFLHDHRTQVKVSLTARERRGLCNLMVSLEAVLRPYWPYLAMQWGDI